MNKEVESPLCADGFPRFTVEQTHIGADERLRWSVVDHEWLKILKPKRYGYREAIRLFNRLCKGQGL